MRKIRWVESVSAVVFGGFLFLPFDDTQNVAGPGVGFDWEGRGKEELREPGDVIASVLLLLLFVVAPVGTA